ncbi:hypothetical protein [Saccharomonospora sp. NB11]|uniref:hypothetical protein n=1 Tax=Saccharomonospora sp. NB11 TaxID=1642298 RepID=UPI001E2C7DB0|nr:hypothetical protein [Saccharomonospora sp. NB11]
MATPLRPLMMLRLLAGRGVFRIGTQAMAVALLTAWGTATYGDYANAWGTCSWLLFLPTAAEKAALKILPRTRLTTAAVAGLTLRIAAVPVLVLVAALVTALLVLPGSSLVTLYLLAGTWSASTGMLMTVAGLHRLRGRPSLDATAFTIVAAIVAATTTVTLVVGLSPTTHLLVLVNGVAVVIAGTLAVLPREWVRAPLPSRRRLTHAFARSTVLLGITELLDAITISSLFIVFAISGRVVDSGPFHLTLLAAGVLCSIALYQLKLKQPETSMNLRGTEGATGRLRAARLLRATEFAGLAFGLALGAALLVPATRETVLAGSEVPPSGVGYVVLAVLVVVEIAMSIALIYGGYLVENTDSQVLSLTATAAALRLVATVVSAFALVPSLGAVGGFSAIVLGLTAEAASLRRLLRRAHPESEHHRTLARSHPGRSGRNPTSSGSIPGSQ